jgi:hypothetical protein
MYVNAKMRPIETITEMEGRGIKGEWWRGWIQVQYIRYIDKNFCKYHNVPHPSKQ